MGITSWRFYSGITFGVSDMKTHRFIVPFEMRDEKILVISNFEILHQMVNVLHLQKNEQLILCDGNGQEYLVHLKDIHPSEGHFWIIEKIQHTVDRKRKVTLYASILKGEHFELLAQKATEVGVHALVPIISERTIKLNVKIERIQKIMKESAEQSGRTIVPSVYPVISFKQSLKQSEDQEIRYFFDFHTPKFLSESIHDLSSVAAFIGPEGGWHKTERALAEKAGCIPVSLGETTLRAETAGIIAAFLLCQ